MIWQRRWRQHGVILAVLALLLTVAIIISASFGAVQIPLRVTAAVLWSRLIRPLTALPETADAIIWGVRLPRVLLGMMVGGALAVSGTIFQGLLRNPMADPYVLGISSGASLGAALAMTITVRTKWLSLSFLPLAAFLGALLAVTLVYTLGRVRGQVSIVSLLLAGVAVSTVLSAVVSFLVYFSGETFQPLVYWLMGGLGSRSWDSLRLARPYITAAVVLALFYGRHLNALALGEEAAHSLGVHVDRVRLVLVGIASLLAATAVSVSGVIGFVGLLVPHALRLVIGGDHRLLLPASFLTGATFLTLADTVARTLLAPTELPVGIVTALCGGPFFLYLLRQRTKS